MPQARTVFEVAQKILSDTYTENLHVIHNGLHANVGHCPTICFEGQQYPRAKILFAYTNQLDVHKLGKIMKICDKPLCICPNHHVEKDKLTDDGTLKDGNGWNSTMRRYVAAKIGLLDKEITEEQCILLNDEKQQECRNVEKKHQLAHVLSLRLKLGRPLEEKMDTSHLCHNRACVNPHHLIEETRRDNLLRTINDGLHKQVKLTQEQVLAIFHSTKKQTEIAKELGVHQGYISNIKTGKIWSHITGKQRKPRVTQLRHEIRITEEDRQKLQKRIQENIDHVQLADDEKQLNTDHWIPKTSFSRNVDGYVLTSFKSFGVRFHQMAIMAYHNMDRFLDTSKPDEFVRHKCRHRDCCNPDHLELGTKKQNAQDKTRDGTQSKSNIHEDLLSQITEALQEQQLDRFEIAKTYGVSLANVECARRQLIHMSSIEMKM